VSGSPQPEPCDCSLTPGLRANQTGLLDFGHSWRGVPETLHIGTYPHIFMWEVRDLLNIKALQKRVIEAKTCSAPLLIAMQKVVGSNPISRFFAIPLHVSGLVSARVAETKWNHPRISPPFGH
jgi:hypothetical protein